MKTPVRFKAIATHPEYRGIYALSEKGELWVMGLETKHWERMPPPFIDVQPEPRPEPLPLSSKGRR